MCGNISKPRQISRLSGSCNADSAHDIHERRESSVGAVIPCPEAFIPTHVGRISMDARRLRRLCHSPPRMWGGCIGVDHAAALVPRFIPTHVGRISFSPVDSTTTSGSSPRTWGGSLNLTSPPSRQYGSSPRTWGGFFLGLFSYGLMSGSSPRTWGGYFPKCSYGWILMNCKPSKSMMVRRGFPYVSMEKPCSLLVE